jgi:hypothetical protein
MRPAPSGESKSRRTKNIRENRRAEKQEEREREAFRSLARAPEKRVGKGEVLPFPSAKRQDDYNLPDITEYLRSFGEGRSGDDDE